MLLRLDNNKTVLTWFLLVFLNSLDEMDLPCWLPLFRYSFLPVVMMISLLNIHKSCKSMPFSVHPRYHVLWQPCSSPCPWPFSILKGVGRSWPHPHSFISLVSLSRLSVRVPTSVESSALWWFRGSMLALQCVGTREPLRMLGFVPTTPRI